MKIQKRAIKSDTELVVEELVPVSTELSPYQCAIDHILDAIDCLGELAKSDALARESIANLSVVLFDLKN